MIANLAEHGAMEICRQRAETRGVQRFQETKKVERAETQLLRYCLSERLLGFVISSNTYADFDAVKIIGNITFILK